jgi:hypothetical protein
MSKFKVGDQVYVRREECKATVTALLQPDGLELEFPSGIKYRCSVYDVEPSENELERLVRVANEGIAAAYTLICNHKDAVERRFASGCLNDVKSALCRANFDIGERFVIKPKQRPLPEPIYVGPCYAGGIQKWKVELSPDRKTITVGCQSFGAEDLHWMLKQLCSETSAQAAVGNTVLAAYREGIAHNSNRLSWADADRLLAWLEKALEEQC